MLRKLNSRKGKTPTRYVWPRKQVFLHEKITNLVDFFSSFNKFMKNLILYTRLETLVFYCLPISFRVGRGNNVLLTTIINYAGAILQAKLTLCLIEYATKTIDELLQNTTANKPYIIFSLLLLGYSWMLPNFVFRK